MFYAAQLVSRDGPLQVLWVAATIDRQLNRQVVDGTAIPRMVEVYLAPDAPAGIFSTGPPSAGLGSWGAHKGKGGCGDERSANSSADAAPLALRLSGQLLLGVCRIYSRKVVYLLEDCEKALMVLKNIMPNEAPPAYGALDHQEDSEAHGPQSSLRARDDSDSRRLTVMRRRRRSTGVDAGAPSVLDAGRSNPVPLMTFDDEEILLEAAGSQQLQRGTLELLLGATANSQTNQEGGPSERGRLALVATPYGGGTPHETRHIPWSGPWTSAVGTAGDTCGGGGGGMLSAPRDTGVAGDAYFEMPDHFEFDLYEHELEALRADSKDIGGTGPRAPPVATATATTAAATADHALALAQNLDRSASPPRMASHNRMRTTAPGEEGEDDDDDDDDEVEEEKEEAEEQQHEGTGRREPDDDDLLEPNGTEQTHLTQSADAPSVITTTSSMAATEFGERQDAEKEEEREEEGIESDTTSSAAPGVAVTVPSCDASGYGKDGGAHSVGDELQQHDASELTPARDHHNCKAPVADEWPGGSSTAPKALSKAATRFEPVAAEKDAIDTQEYDTPGGLPTHPRFGVAMTTVVAVTNTAEPAACGNGESGDGDAAKLLSPPPQPPMPKPRRAAALRAQAALAAPADDASEGGRVSKRRRDLGGCGPAGDGKLVLAAGAGNSGGALLRADGSRTQMEHGGCGKSVTLDVDREGYIHVALPTHLVRELLQDRSPLLDIDRRDAALHRSMADLATCKGGPWLGCQIYTGCHVMQSLFNHHRDRTHQHKYHRRQLLHHCRHRHQKYRQLHRGRVAANAVGRWVLTDEPLDVAAGPWSIPGTALAPVLQHLFRYLAGRAGDSYCEQLPGWEQERAQNHKAKVTAGREVIGPSSPAPISSGIKVTRASGSSSSSGADGPAAGVGSAEAGTAVVTTVASLTPSMDLVHLVNCRTLIRASDSLMASNIATATDDGSGAAAGAQELNNGAQIVDLADCDEAGPLQRASVGSEGHSQQQQQPPADKGDGGSNLQAGEGGDEEDEEDSQEDEDTRLLVEDAGALSGMPLCTNNEIRIMDGEEVEQPPDGSTAEARRWMAADGFTARTQAMLQMLQAMVATAYSERKQRDAACKPAKRRRLDADVAAAVPDGENNEVQPPWLAAKLRHRSMHPTEILGSAFTREAAGQGRPPATAEWLPLMLSTISWSSVTGAISPSERHPPTLISPPRTPPQLPRLRALPTRIV
ncbi:hypothetical protein VaNZ11_006760 [Volvox africanus]|uniref:Rad21/Rec8-like protein N-terminal domain-containing protein n=1 Tax=Volvox africanus TaxID=51714 RepID=A0ABQ5S1G5_9CHLO|nr:hypothetical protein VaNZ11_006760 [Volvox africanus]